MADELVLNASMVYEDAQDGPMSLSVADLEKTVSSRKPVRLIQEVGVTEEAIDLGDAAPAYAMFKNLDPTNYIELKVATGGAVFAKLDPDTDSDGKGGFAVLKLGSGAQAPYAIANSAACRMAVMICPA